MNIAAVAVIAATLCSYVLGSLWYLALGRKWRRAVGWIEGPVPYRPKLAELAIALVGQSIMAVALWIAIDRMNTAGVVKCFLTGAAIWLGFVLPTLATNVVFQRRNPSLIWQDGGHWLLLLAAQGAVLGYFH
ncbi:DUF1761 domain-containing protein [Lichenifustis flavocetrariae]|uniref:DUF1761 domain-containing protein n=1 Tax=Lichenifustis flavocetrariae TaxID=2949735 RepID=A0AA42CQB7_9HYPH|nr:DUF1761 domain-containing protein [Lichenifustis flavocetrariae]MCW6511297.1 DUF1761 domain-containing protein [Lichenifustis flavocetrariae]